MNQAKFTLSIHAAVFTSLMIIGTFIRIPFGPVPIVLANFFAILSGILLGPLWGGASVGLYLLLGAAGLPVFSAGGGAALFLGPTGGYLVGYLAAAMVAGMLSSCGKENSVVLAAAATGAACVIYLIGVPWLMWRIGAATGHPVPLSRALTIGLYPFIPGDILKITALVVVAKAMMRFSPLLREGQ